MSCLDLDVLQMKHFPLIFKQTHLAFFVHLSLSVALLATSLSIWASHVLRSSGGQEGFPFSICHSFSFLFFRWWCGMVCVPRRGRGERKASRWIWVAAVTKACFPGPLFVCSQPIGSRRLSPTIHPCENRKRWKALMTVKGLTRERERGRKRKRGERERKREARTGFSVFLLSSPVVLDVA